MRIRVSERPEKCIQKICCIIKAYRVAFNVPQQKCIEHVITQFVIHGNIPCLKSCAKVPWQLKRFMRHFCVRGEKTRLRFWMRKGLRECWTRIVAISTKLILQPILGLIQSNVELFLTSLGCFEKLYSFFRGFLKKMSSAMWVHVVFL